MQSFSTRHELFALFIRLLGILRASRQVMFSLRTYMYVRVRKCEKLLRSTQCVRHTTYVADFSRHCKPISFPWAVGSFFRVSKRPSFSHHRSSQIFLYCRANFPPPASSLRHKVLPCDKRLSISLTICIPPALLIASRGLFGCPPGPHNIFFLFFGSNPIIVIDKQNRPQISNHCKNRS